MKKDQTCVRKNTCELSTDLKDVDDALASCANLECCGGVFFKNGDSDLGVINQDTYVIQNSFTSCNTVQSGVGVLHGKKQNSCDKFMKGDLCDEFTATDCESDSDDAFCRYSGSVCSDETVSTCDTDETCIVHPFEGYEQCVKKDDVDSGVTTCFNGGFSYEFANGMNMCICNAKARYKDQLNAAWGGYDCSVKCPVFVPSERSPTKDGYFKPSDPLYSQILKDRETSDKGVEICGNTKTDSGLIQRGICDPIEQDCLCRATGSLAKHGCRKTECPLINGTLDCGYGTCKDFPVKDDFKLACACNVDQDRLNDRYDLDSKGPYEIMLTGGTCDDPCYDNGQNVCGEYGECGVDQNDDNFCVCERDWKSSGSEMCNEINDCASCNSLGGVCTKGQEVNGLCSVDLPDRGVSNCSKCVCNEQYVGSDCSSCADGYKKENGECTPYTGTCANGTLITQEDRQQDNHCGSCNSGYYLSNKKCEPYSATCANGQRYPQAERTSNDDGCKTCNYPCCQEIDENSKQCVPKQGCESWLNSYNLDDCIKYCNSNPTYGGIQKRLMLNHGNLVPTQENNPLLDEVGYCSYACRCACDKQSDHSLCGTV